MTKFQAFRLTCYVIIGVCTGGLGLPGLMFAYALDPMVRNWVNSSLADGKKA